LLPFWDLSHSERFRQFNSSSLRPKPSYKDFPRLLQLPLLLQPLLLPQPQLPPLLLQPQLLPLLLQPQLPPLLPPQLLRRRKLLSLQRS
jgi:hypothetical protein